MPDSPILVINTGSSSLKFGLYTQAGNDEQLLLDGLADGLGQPSGKLTIKDPDGHELRSEPLNAATPHQALTQAAQWLADLSKTPPVAIGHRVVHGGPNLTTHQRITPDLIRELEAAVHFAPLHIPPALDLIKEAERTFPNLPQFACFDTAFHTTIPKISARFPLPDNLYREGIHRYGFHGLSYESICRQLGPDLPSRTVIAHLGSGASLAAVLDGKSVDTSMGLTPTGGIPMATRSGDLDPGILLYLLRAKNLTADALEQLLNHDSGLKALSDGTSDVRKLQAAANSDDPNSPAAPNARLALDTFALAVARYIAEYTTVLGGLDLVVFTGGIGEHSASVRQAVVNRLTWFGLSLDTAANQSSNATISSPFSTVPVRVITTEEDRQIARHSRELLAYTSLAQPQP